MRENSSTVGLYNLLHLFEFLKVITMTTLTLFLQVSPFPYNFANKKVEILSVNIFRDKRSIHFMVPLWTLMEWG